MSTNPPDTTYLSHLDLETLAEDASHLGEILERHPTVFFRPGDRTSPDFPTYWRANAQGISVIGLITRYGNHETKQPPEFLPERIPVRVVSRTAKRMSDITTDECASAYTELSSPEAIQAWLQTKYPHIPLDPDAIITMYQVEYLS